MQPAFRWQTQAITSLRVLYNVSQNVEEWSPVEFRPGKYKSRQRDDKPPGSNELGPIAVMHGADLDSTYGPRVSLYNPAVALLWL